MRCALLLFVAGLIGCAPLPPPGSIPPPPDAGPPDIFTGYVADCSDPSVAYQSARASTFIAGCPEFDGGWNACLLKATDTFTKDAIVCATVDLNVDWQRKVTEGTATDAQRKGALMANSWIYEHQIGVRR